MVYYKNRNYSFYKGDRAFVIKCHIPSKEVAPGLWVVPVDAAEKYGLSRRTARPIEKLVDENGRLR